jgi:hypothetical protein
VVAYEHPIKGQGIYAYVTLMQVGPLCTGKRDHIRPEINTELQ